jgi:hypothetical protein
MTLMPEVHDALARAVAARAHRRRWRPSRQAGAVALAVAVLAGSALAATGWHPVLGSDRGGHPRAAGAAVPADQSARLGVLRRAQTGGDRGPEVGAVLRMLVRGEVNGIHTDGVRVLRRRPDGVTLLVPAERVGRHDLGYASSIERRVLCVLTSARTGGLALAGQSCGDAAQLRTRGIGGITRSSDGLILNGLVPDGVVRVIVQLRGRRRFLAVPVRENLYEVNVGSDPRLAAVSWVDARGRIIGPAKIG